MCPCSTRIWYVISAVHSVVSVLHRLKLFLLFLAFLSLLFRHCFDNDYLHANVGLTETCAGTFVSLPNELSMLGTVGPPVPNVDVCLESVPEMGYDALSTTPRGEVCVRGDPLFSGYYKRDDLTNEVMIDGWFHTGNLSPWNKSYKTGFLCFL